MRPLPLLAVGAVLFAGAALWMFVSSIPVNRVDTAESDLRTERPEGPDPELAPLDVGPLDRASVPSGNVTTRQPASGLGSPGAAEEPAEDAGACVVVGVATDENDVPIADALIQLGAYKDWAGDGVGQPLARFGPNRWTSMHGFEARTGLDGGFRLAVPVPTAESCAFYVAPGRHYDSFDTWFGGDRRGARRPLVEGQRDLGTIRLARAGAIVGHVSDTSGVPIEGVRMSIGSEPSLTLGRYAVTEADGSYVIAHAPLGTYGVRTKLEGYVSEFRDPVTVEAGRDSGPIDFQLERAPEISGRVVSTDGEVVENARLWGWPKSSGSGAGARSDPGDGTFTIYLPQDEPYSLEVTHPDYVKWGDASNKTELFEPGTADLVITMQRASKTHFVVVDAETKGKVERFGFNILEENGSKSERGRYTERRRPRLKDHADGAVDVAAREGIDLYVVHAEGYLLATGDVEADEAGGTVQTIELQRGAGVRGHVLREGAPVEGVAVALVAGSRHSRTGGMFRADDNTQQGTETDAGGAFTFEGAGAGMHRITVVPNVGAPIVVEIPSLTPPEVKDLGDLVLGDGGTIEGVVLLPTGIDPGGLTVYLGEHSAENAQVTDGSGRFRFEHVPVGEHQVWQLGRQGILDDGATVTVAVEEGETVNVELDCFPFSLVDIEITLRSGALPLDGVGVELIAPGASTVGTWREKSATHIELGKTDASGVARGAGRAFGLCDVSVQIPGVGPMRLAESPVLVQFGSPVNETLTLEFASLEFQCDERHVLPQNGKLYVTLREGDETFPVTNARIPIENGLLQAVDSAFVDVEGRRVRIGGLGAGARRASVYAVASDAPRVESTTEDGRRRFGAKRDFELMGSVTLVPGETATLDVQ